MTLVCFLVLVRYANKYSVIDFATSQEYAKMFSFYVMILIIVPPILAFMELIRMLRYLRDICNWKRDMKDEEESFGSSEPSKKEDSNESKDLLKHEKTEDSLVEKEISLSSSEEEYVPRKQRDPDEPNSLDREYLDEVSEEDPEPQ